MACCGRSSIDIRRDEPLQSRNTLALAASASAFATVHNRAEVGEALAWARAAGLAAVPLGEGSNVVLAGDLDQLVLRVASSGRQVLAEQRGEVLLQVAAGENWHRLVSWCLEQGYHGLENLALIPGTVGAAPIQNIGAYGVELSEFLVAVNAVDLDSGETQRLPAQDCLLGYRDSVFKQVLRDRLLIESIELRLPRLARVEIGYPTLAAHFEDVDSSTLTPRDVFDAVVAIRRARLPDPAQIPNAGSFFKNPLVSAQRARELQQRYPDLPGYPAGPGRVKLPAAFLIERCGFRGHRDGVVGVHSVHALVLVNYGGGSGPELLALARSIEAAVAAQFDIRLEIEPRVYGVSP